MKTYKYIQIWWKVWDLKEIHIEIDDNDRERDYIYQWLIYISLKILLEVTIFKENRKLNSSTMKKCKSWLKFYSFKNAYALSCFRGNFNHLWKTIWSALKLHSTYSLRRPLLWYQFYGMSILKKSYWLKQYKNSK